MPRPASALLFAVLWTGAMPWASLPLDPVSISLTILTGGLAGLTWYALCGPACAAAEEPPVDAPPTRPAPAAGASGFPRQSW